MIIFLIMSMGIVGVNSTAGREVKFIDPSKTTKSESSWLGYTLCVWPKLIYTTHNTKTQSFSVYYTLQWRTKVGGSKRIRYPRRPINYIKRWALNCILQSCRFDLSSTCKHNLLAWARISIRSPLTLLVRSRWTFLFYIQSLRVSIVLNIFTCWNCVHLIFGALRSI